MRVAHLLKQYRKSINPPYDQKDLLVIFLTIFILISIPLTSLAVINSRQPVSKAAGTATMTLSPTSLSVNQNSSFSVQVREDSAAETVNAVSAYLTFDVNKLTVANVSTTGTAFEMEVENVVGSGTINITRGTTTPKTGNQLIATITFTAKISPGATSISFAAGSAVVRSTDNTH